MSEPRGEIEVFSAGCSLCHRAVSLVLSLAHESREVVIRDMRDPAVARRAGGARYPLGSGSGHRREACGLLRGARSRCGGPASSRNRATRRTVAQLRQGAPGTRLGRSGTDSPSSAMSRDGQPAARAADFLDTALGPEADHPLDEAIVVHSQCAQNATEYFRQGGDLA